MGKKKGAEEGGAPGWIVTFSDLMSLLLTFFVLLLSFSTISEDDFNEAMMSLQGAFGLLPSFTSVVAPLPSRHRRKAEEVAEMARRLRRQMQIIGEEKKVKIEMDALGGLKINLPSAVLFDLGSAVLRPQAFEVLQDVAEVLSELPDTFIEVRGHTDGSPIANAGPHRDNYDLSYARADAVTRQITAFGKIPMNQFEIISCGPSQPLATNTTEDGRSANRRVEIYVRGLVDRSTMEGLREGLGSLNGLPLLDSVPMSPLGVEGLR